MPQLQGGFGLGSYGSSSSQNQGLGSSYNQSAPGIIPGIMNVYDQLLGLNTANYNNVLGQYQQGREDIAAAFPGIYAGYDRQKQEVMNTLGNGAKLGGDNWGVAQPAANKIGELYTQNKGATDQQLVNAGLGNTTARGNFQAQNTQRAARQYGELGAQLADKAAGYQNQIGLAQNQAGVTAAQLQAQLDQAHLGNLAGYRFANTAGNLTGQFSSGSSQNQSSGASEGTNRGGGGGGGGGVSGGGSGGNSQSGIRRPFATGGYGGGGAQPSPFGGGRPNGSGIGGNELQAGKLGGVSVGGLGAPQGFLGGGGTSSPGYSGFGQQQSGFTGGIPPGARPGISGIPASSGITGGVGSPALPGYLNPWYDPNQGEYGPFGIGQGNAGDYGGDWLDQAEWANTPDGGYGDYLGLPLGGYTQSYAPGDYGDYWGLPLGGGYGSYGGYFGGGGYSYY